MDGNASMSGQNPSAPGVIPGVGRTMFFSADDGTHGVELFRRTP
jgi:hypothetical protein